MATSTPLSLLTTFYSSKLISEQYTCRQPRRSSLSLRPGKSYSFPPFLKTSTAKLPLLRHAYISAPGADTIVNEADPNLPKLEEEWKEIEKEDTRAVSWGLLWGLLSQHKLRLAISVLTLVGCTTCTLSMPIFSGRFFEVLIGARPGPLWKLLSKVGVLYAMEPICTVIFVINMNTIWEKVMSTLRAQIFRRILIQKVEFFDQYKVGELTGLLTSDLGSLKNVVSENISRDRGFRALSEASYSTLRNKSLGRSAYYSPCLHRLLRSWVY